MALIRNISNCIRISHTARSGLISGFKAPGGQTIVRDKHHHDVTSAADVIRRLCATEFPKGVGTCVVACVQKKITAS